MRMPRAQLLPIAAADAAADAAAAGLPYSTEQTAFSCKCECGAYIIALMG